MFWKECLLCIRPEDRHVECIGGVVGVGPLPRIPSGGLGAWWGGDDLSLVSPSLTLTLCGLETLRPY